MTRKRFMKLMMGSGYSRNTAREVVKLTQERKETEDRMKHHIKVGEPVLVAKERGIMEALDKWMASIVLKKEWEKRNLYRKK